MKKITKNFEDINFTVVMNEGEQNNAYVSFKVYEIMGIETDGEFVSGEFLYPAKSSKSSEDTVNNVNDSQIYLSGSIKWDGCSNMNFDEQERVMLHFCEKKLATDIGVLMGYLYDMAAELMPDNSKYLE